MTTELGRGAQVQLAGMAKAAARGAVASSVEGNDAAKRAWVSNVTAIAADVALLTERVLGLEGQSAVPGPQGDVGPAGAASTVAGPAGKDGAAGIGTKGDPGAAGAASIVPGPPGRDGTNGTNGKDGAPGAASTVAGPKGDAGAKGDAGQAGPAGADGALSIRRARLTTAADGTVVWTYPAPFAAGVGPIIAALPEATAGAPPYVVQIDGVPTNTAAKFRVSKAAQLGAVTSFSAAASVRLHVSAIAPT
jgi:hypothetical protein